MKNFKLLFILGALMTVCLTSCVPDETCKKCRAVTSDKNGTVLSETTPSEYCGDGLTEKENAAPVTIGDETTKWVCE